jgi:hypothetical protein
MTNGETLGRYKIENIPFARPLESWRAPVNVGPATYFWRLILVVPS